MISDKKMKRFVEIRSLNLRPGTRKDFQRVFVAKSLPLLKMWKMDVVDFGPSLHDENTFYVVRAFDSLTHRQKTEDAFYGSVDWWEGPREELVGRIENYIDVVLEMEEKTVNALRNNVTLQSSRLPHWEKEVLSKHGLYRKTFKNVPGYLIAFWKRHLRNLRRGREKNRRDPIV